jgi:hypothetical protein
VPILSLSPIKQEILETMLLEDKPMKAMQIAMEIGKEFPPVMMHLIGLIRIGYVFSPEKGLYLLTEKGKKFFGIQDITKDQAEAILAYVSHDKAFNFYAAVGKPLNLHAHTLRDFANKLQRADASSIEFHLGRGDFEAWFVGLGDKELAKKTALLKEKKVVGEDLRKSLIEIVEQRYVLLAKLADQTIPTE